MNFSSLTKEQKQLVILGVGGCFTLIMIVSNLVIGPAKEKAAEAEEIILELENKVASGERILRRNVRVQRDVNSFSSEILAIHESELPPRTSPYVWAVENLSLLADELGLNLSIQEHPTTRYIPVSDSLKNLNVNSIPYWVPYSVDVKINTSFAKLQSFLVLLEKALPYASIGEITIQASSNTPERHQITVLVEWPTFRFEEDLRSLTELTQTGDRK